MIDLSSKWLKVLADKPETGMGYQVACILTQDGKKFDHAVIVEGRISQVRGYDQIPFCEDQITEIILTHDKWKFR